MEKINLWSPKKKGWGENKSGVWINRYTLLFIEHQRL